MDGRLFDQERPGDPDTYEITRVEQQVKKPGMFDIYLNGQLAFTVHEDTLVTMRLLKGRKLDRSELAQLAFEERVSEALAKAIRVIGRRAHSAAELMHKLRQAGVEEDVIEAVMRKLRSEQLVDDRSFAEQWTESRMNSRKKGRNWVRYELEQKGIAKEHIEAALRSVDWSVEYDNALQLARKKWQKTEGDLRARRHKTAAYLMRRGYPSDIVRKAINECASEQQSCEEN